MNPNSQVLFVLFSDSEDVNRVGVSTEEKKTEKRINVDALKWIFRYEYLIQLAYSITSVVGLISGTLHHINAVKNM